MDYKTEVLGFPPNFNVIPLMTGGKGQSFVKWSEYQNKPISSELFNEWFVKYSKECNWGILTGKTSNLVVVDIDSKEGVEYFESKGIDILSLPTLICRTGSGRGCHIYFTYPTSYEVRNSASLITDKVDIRGEGGLVVAPGSTHPKTGGLYKWLEGHSPTDVQVMQCPGWLLEMLKATGNTEKPTNKADKDSMSDELNNIIQNGVGEGQRNDSAARVAGYYINKGLGYNEVELLLKGWNAKNSPPLSEAELDKVLESVASRDENKIFTKDGKPKQGRVADLMMKNHELRFLPHEGNQFYIYNNGVFAPDTDGNIWLKKDILSIVGKSVYNDTFANKVLDIISMQDGVIMNESQTERNTEILNVKNGILNLKTMTLSEHTPKVFTTAQIPVAYDKDADCPKFKEYLRTTLKEEYHKTIQEFMGYCLVPTCKYQKALMLYGTGGNGKSVFIDVLTALIGESNSVSINIGSLCRNRFAAVKLRDKLLNACSENPVKLGEENEMLKAMITGDRIMVEDKGQPAFSMRPTTKHVFSVNQLPKMADWSEGNYRRWIIIKFEEYFKETPNRDLTEEIIEELPGILNFALEGLQRLVAQNGFTTGELIEQNIHDMAIQNDSVMAFVEEQCILSEGLEGRSQNLYNLYKDFVVDDGRKYPVSHKSFTTRLKEVYKVSSQHRRDGEYLKGIGLKYEE